MASWSPFHMALWTLAAHLEAFRERWGAASERPSGLPSPMDAEARAWRGLADRLGAGMAPMVGRWEFPARLRSIFARIAGGDGAAGYHALAALDPSREVLFPDQARGAEAPEEEYRNLLRGLDAVLPRAMSAARDHPGAAVAALLGVMARFLWCVPVSSDEDLQDVPLYDHARVAAALAAVLAGAPAAQLAEWERALTIGAPGSPVALLIKGDVSGIQSFLYQVSGKGTARGLRGRSFYLQLLSEAVAMFLLRRLDLPLVNLLYSSGGHFWVLARASDAERLPEIRREVEQRLVMFHGMDLGVFVAAELLRPADLHAEGLARILHGLGRQLSEAKRRRFAELPPEEWGERLLRTTAAAGSGPWTDCSICGQVGRVGEHVLVDTRNPDLRKCRRCQSFEELGRVVPKLGAVAWLWLKEPVAVPRASMEFAPWADVFPAFGIQPAFFDEEGDRMTGPEIPPDFEWALIWAIDPRLWEPEARARVEAPLGPHPMAFIPRFVLRYVPYVTDQDREDFREQYEVRGEEPPEIGSIRDFEILEGRSRGIQRLGVLRADLDSAGRLFSEGLGAHLTLSRMTALSGALSRFFEGYVETLCREADVPREGSGVIYALYSGGDDLFLAGAWDEVLELAERLRRALGDYTGGHPRIGLSAGFTLHGGRESARRMAEAAGEALDIAKAYEDPAGGRAKDAIAFLDQAIPWKPGELFEEIRRWKTRFVEAVEESEGDPRRSGRGRSLLFALIRWAILIRREWEQGGSGDSRPVAGQWLWQFPYFLRRWLDLAQGREPMSSLLEEMRQEWESGDLSRQAELLATVWGPAARWAEMLTRQSDRGKP